MSKDKKQKNKELVDRLKRAEGQIKAVRKMCQEDNNCFEATQQLLAARSALEKVAIMVLEQELQSCCKKSSQGRFKKALKQITKITN